MAAALTAAAAVDGAKELANGVTAEAIVAAVRGHDGLGELCRFAVSDDLGQLRSFLRMAVAD